MADVHRIGKRIARRTNFLVIAARQKFGERVVVVHSRDDFAHGQTHFAGNDGAHHVAEIAARHGKHHRLACLSHARRGIKIINALRQQAPDVDGICGRQRQMFQVRIRECPFHHRLTVVEFSVDFHRADVVLECGHQLALAFADFANWKQNNHAHAGNFMKCVCDRRAGVAARRRENYYLLAVFA